MKKHSFLLALLLTVGAQVFANNIIQVTQANFASLSPLQSNTTYVFIQNIDASGIAPTSAFQADGISQVTIDLNGFTLTLADGQTGIQIDNSNPTAGLNTDIAVRNGTIKANVLAVGGNSNGILATFFNGLTVEDVTFVNTRRGVASADQLAENRNATINRCIFNLASDTNTRGITFGTIIGLRVQDCGFLPASIDLNVRPIHILLINNASEISINHCNFGSAAIAISVQSNDRADLGFLFQFASSNVFIDQCDFEGKMLTGITAQASETIIRNSSFSLESYYDQTSTAGIRFGTAVTLINGVFVAGGPEPKGCLIENCKLELNNTALDVFATVGLELGDDVQNASARDIIVRNSSFSQKDAPAEHFDLWAGQVHGLLVDNCTFDSNSTGRDAQGNPIIDPFTGVPIKSANIHLGFGSADDAVNLYTSDVIIRDSICKGGSQVGIRSDNGDNTVHNARITIENSCITATEVGIELNNTISANIVDSTIKNVLGSPFAEGIGVHLSGPLSYNPTASSKFNEISESTITNNTVGIVIEPGASCNLVDNNKILKNTRCQISTSKNNKFVDNLVVGENHFCAPSSTAYTMEEAQKNTANVASNESTARNYKHLKAEAY